jgi:hypothetical protein
MTRGTNESKVAKRMAELVKPVDRQIMMCDDKEEILMMACVMLQRVRQILDSQIGIDGRRQLFDSVYGDETI